MIYLSGTYSRIHPSFRHKFGYMLNVNRAIGGEAKAVRQPWMLDNGAYSDKWDEATWAKRLARLSKHNATCLGAVVPDVVGDAQATLSLWDTYAPAVKQHGYKALFVTQDGCKSIPKDADGIFVGGTDGHKLHESFPLIAEAKSRGIWVHVGRVNSKERILMFRDADSVDGTTFVYDNSIQSIKNILRGVHLCNNQTHVQLCMLDLLPQHTQC